ncbi:MAG: hypothetical protein K2Y29_05805 [Beijerinckiaceae bacterium]|nr:hypothetical protein [Beijerinckiaceae bacterium]
MRSVAAAVIAVAAASHTCAARAENNDASKPVSDRQVAVLMFVDYGRSYGYQSMLAAIQIDVVKAEIERDQALLAQKEELYRKKAIPLVELEIARLKDVWNRKQLIVAEKSLATVTAQYEAMGEMAKHFAGVDVAADALYAKFRRAWDAGCDKGPDEVAAMKAWAEFSAKSIERARQFNRRGVESTASLLEKEVRQKVAEANYSQRESRLARCREVLFPAFDEILKIGR